MRRNIAAIFLALAIASVTGCSSGDSERPLDGGQPSPLTSSSNIVLPHSGAPKVSSPLPASVLAGDPCVDALTPDQIKQALGSVFQGLPGQLVTGKKCDWSNQETGAFVAVSYYTDIHEGLSAVYQNVRPKALVWRELPTVQSFPAVAYVTEAGGTPQEFCSVSVGLADDLAFNVSGFLSRAKQKDKADPCEGAAKVSDMVVTTLRQKVGA